MLRDIRAPIMALERGIVPVASASLSFAANLKIAARQAHRYGAIEIRSQDLRSGKTLQDIRMRMSEAAAIADRNDGDGGPQGGEEFAARRRAAAVMRHEQHVGGQLGRAAPDEIALGSELDVAGEQHRAPAGRDLEDATEVVG